MADNPAQPLVKVRIRRWRNIRSGWLTIEPARITVFRRQFLRAPVHAAEFDTGQVAAAELHTPDKGVLVTLQTPEQEMTSELFLFVSDDDAAATSLTLSSLLEEAKEKKRLLEEEAVRIKREFEERQARVRREFAADVWGTAESVWDLSKADYAIADAVIAGNWDGARQAYSTVWQLSDRLKSAHGIDLSTPLKELDDAVCAEDGEQVIKKAASLVRSIGDQVLQTDLLWSRWKQEESTTSNVSPGWHHLPYFLLFGGGLLETLLSLRTEDWTGVSDGLAVLRSTAVVLTRCFKVNLGDLLDVADRASAERDERSLGKTAERVEDALSAAFKGRPFDCGGPIRESFEESSGVLSKRA